MKYSSILVPLDGSQLSEGILPYARALAKAFKIPIELLEVIDPDTIEASSRCPDQSVLDIVEADMKMTCADYLNKTARSLQPSLTVNCSVEIGNPAEVIVDRASAHTGTLIAMATHGRSGVQRWFLGSVADKVLLAGANPLLLVRTVSKGQPSDEAPLETILVPLDGSSLAELVLPHVAAIAKKMKLEVVFIRVHSAPAKAKGYLDRKVQQLREKGINRASYVLPGGDVAGNIIDIARETPNNLVAMCTHGRSGIGRWVLGSITSRVVRHCGDSVLIVRPPRTDGA